ncbi:MAG: right-handed parallel beta-helix repeat-containing protein [Chloroflexia bacterium]
MTRTTQRGLPAFSVLRLNGGTTATLQGLTISNGRDSSNGGINVDSATLTLIDSSVSGNTRECGWNRCQSWQLTLTNSTVSGNSAGGSGGGIYSNAGTHGVTDSTIENNSSTAGNGGGIGIQSSTVTVTNSTVSDNSPAVTAAVSTMTLAR